MIGKRSHLTVKSQNKRYPYLMTGGIIMKRQFFTLMCLLLCICITGCAKNVISDSGQQTSSPETKAETKAETEAETEAETGVAYITSNAYYKILPAKKTSTRVDITYVDRYLLLSGNYPNYHEILRNVPNIHSYFVNITPDELRRKCAIYRCTYNGTSLGGQTFLVYGDSVFNLCGDYYGYGGGYGVTEFAYQEAEDKLYFIYSFGSGVISTHVGVLDLKTRTLSDYYLRDHSTLELPNFFNASFCLSEDKDTLGLCLADYKWNSSNSFEIDIQKGECFLEDITTLDFKEIVSVN